MTYVSRNVHSCGQEECWYTVLVLLLLLLLPGALNFSPGNGSRTDLLLLLLLLTLLPLLPIAFVVVGPARPAVFAAAARCSTLQPLLNMLDRQFKSLVSCNDWDFSWCCVVVHKVHQLVKCCQCMDTL